jgi:predicted MFS family arabinose efflux permease
MLWLICFFNYADRQTIYSVFPLVECDFHFSPLQLGLLGSAFAWIYAIAGPRKPLSSPGSKSGAATALSGRFMPLLLFRATEGLGESVYFPASMSTPAAYHPGDTRSIVSL